MDRRGRLPTVASVFLDLCLHLTASPRRSVTAGADSGRQTYVMHDHRVILVGVVSPQDQEVLVTTTQRYTPQVDRLKAPPTILRGTRVRFETIQSCVHLDGAAPRAGVFLEFGQVGVCFR